MNATHLPIELPFIGVIDTSVSAWVRIPQGRRPLRRQACRFDRTRLSAWPRQTPSWRPLVKTSGPQTERSTNTTPFRKSLNGASPSPPRFSIWTGPGGNRSTCPLSSRSGHDARPCATYRAPRSNIPTSASWGEMMPTLCSNASDRTPVRFVVTSISRKAATILAQLHDQNRMRRTQRKPMWLVGLSSGWRCRADAR